LCLKLIQGDASVRILRLKNKFCVQEHETLGYRCVFQLSLW
jgi:hypothetical protein